jgi:hypothetical protein
MRIRALENRVSSLERMLRTGPRSWHLLMAVDEPIPPAVAEQIQEGDTLVIRRYPGDIASLEGASLGWMISSSGTRIVYSDGSLEPLGQDPTGRKRR